MGSVALCLPLLFFLHAFNPKAAIAMLPVVAMSWWSAHTEFDDWLIDLTFDYQPPNGKILIITDETAKFVETTLGVVWYVAEWESVPYPLILRRKFGMVVMETSEKLLSDFRLEYIYECLIPGGKFIGVNMKQKKVHMVVNKEDLE
jgi:hypothetical protein